NLFLVCEKLFVILFELALFSGANRSFRSFTSVIVHSHMNMWVAAHIERKILIHDLNLVCVPSRQTMQGLCSQSAEWALKVREFDHLNRRIVALIAKSW